MVQTIVKYGMWTTSTLILEYSNEHNTLIRTIKLNIYLYYLPIHP